MQTDHARWHHTPQNEWLSVRTDGPEWEVTEMLLWGGWWWSHRLLAQWPPQVVLQRRGHTDGQTPRGRRCSQLPPHVQLGRPGRGVAWRHHGPLDAAAGHALPTSQRTLAGPSVQPQEPLVGLALLPAGVWVAATLDPSVPGSSCPCGTGHNCFHLPTLPPVSPPRHMCRDKTNSPGARHCLARPCVRLSVTWVRAPHHGFPLQGWAPPLPGPGAQPPAVHAQLVSGVGVSC